MMTATTTNNELFLRAINFKYIAGGLGVGLVSYAFLSALNLPVMLIYGFIRGIGGLPHGAIPELFGALLGHYYFSRRFGFRRWKQYATVLFAGYACGMGLVGMGGAALAMVVNSVRQLPY